jgi:alpha-L-fucosidase 2
VGRSAADRQRPARRDDPRHVGEERIELNDNTLYSGEPGRRDLPNLNVSKTLEQVNQQLREGKYAEVTDWVSKNWLGRQQECYQPLGDLYLKLRRSEADRGALPPRAGYRQARSRGPSISAGRVTFVARVLREFSGQAIVMPAVGDKPGAISFARGWRRCIRPRSRRSKAATRSS